MAKLTVSISIAELADEILKRLKHSVISGAEGKGTISLETLAGLSHGFEGNGSFVSADLIDVVHALNVLVKTKKIEMAVFIVSGLASSDPRMLSVSFKIIDESH